MKAVRFFINSPDLAGFDMTVLAVQDRASLLHEVGGRFWGALQYNFVGALYLIPRLLWPGKPTYTDLGTFFYQHAGGNEEGESLEPLRHAGERIGMVFEPLPALSV